MARSRHGIVSAEAAEDFRGVQRAIDAAPDELARLLSATAADQLSGAWADELAKRPATPAQRRFVLAGARTIPHAGGLRAETGDGELARVFEFGTNNRETYTTYRRRSPKGRTHSVTRRTRRQIPPRRAGGYIAYPAANRLGTRAFAMWAQLIRKVTHDWMEGKNG